MDLDDAAAPAGQLARALRNREISSRDLLDLLLARADGLIADLLDAAAGPGFTAPPPG
jgi:hypothetical protein